MSKTIRSLTILAVLSTLLVIVLIKNNPKTESPAKTPEVATTQSESEVDQMLRESQEITADKEILENMMNRLELLNSQKLLTEKSLEKVVDETYSQLKTSRGKSMLMIDFYIKVLAQNTVPK